MGCALYRDFTLQRSIMLAVLDARMNLTPSLTAICVSDLYNLFLSFWRHATMVPPRNCLLHDLISRVFLRSLQYGIVVLGFLDAFVCAHHKHRLDSANAGNFGDCLAGRVRFMTAITPAYAHAYQTICLGMYFPGVPHSSFRLLRPKARCPFLPNDRSLSKEVGHDNRGCLYRWWFPCCG